MLVNQVVVDKMILIKLKIIILYAGSTCGSISAISTLYCQGHGVGWFKG